MLGAKYETKKLLKQSIGKNLDYIETSLFGKEFQENGKFCVVGPCPYTDRKWYAEVTMANGKIKSVK